MLRKSVILGMVLLLAAFGGCASVSQKTSQLSSRIDDLESKVSSLEEQQEQIKEVVVSQIVAQRSTVEADSPKADVQIPVDPSNKDIQISLKNAGLYDGEIDGKIGSKTRNAVMEFQKQNNLKVDGVVGKNTWEILSKFYTEEENS